MKISNFRFYNPVKLIAGDKALGSLPYELKQLDSQRPLIITDPGVREAGLIDLVYESLESKGDFNCSMFDRVPPDSSPAVVNSAAGMFRQEACDALVAVGGGSVIDTAKAVNIVISEEVDDIIELKGAKLKKTMQPFIVIPTTAGTGSEVTYAAMLRDAEHRAKLLFASYNLFPDTALLDPRMTLTLPPLATAATAMDALCHAMESCISNAQNPISDAHAVAAIKLIHKHLPRVLENETDAHSRFQLANAACMAGAAFSNSGVGVVHALGHALGGVCGVPHGVAMSIFLPHGLAFNMSVAREAIGEMLLPLSGPEDYVQTPPSERAAKTLAVVQELKEKLYSMAGLPRTLSEAGVSEDNFEDIARKALRDPALNFNPTAANYDEIQDILQKAFNSA
ncbi:MAG: iron-containing alcohol dehydrogenase [Deltaproteobacteria bacterium]|jgi:alcohol dehydrogenase|nr:iron-containing alcohol dehydrogenase [Deltaproteobacteria bacterium]